MPLFKYAPATAIDYFNPCTLRFSPPGEFNDPFDGVSSAAPILQSAAFKQMVADHLSFTPAQLADPELAAGVAVAQRIVEDKTLEGYRDKLLADLNKNFRVLCLSKASPESLGAALMWGHYAQDPSRRNKPHAGIALEFDDSDPWFKDHLSRPDRAMQSVNYRSTRPVIDTDKRAVLFVKSAPWQYEEEVRLVRSIGSGANDLSGSDQSIAYYPPRMLKVVYIGLYADPSLADTLKARLALNPDLRHVVIRHVAAIDPRDYKLRITD